jgi:hypothetical protein
MTLVDTIASAQNLHVARAAFREYVTQYPGPEDDSADRGSWKSGMPSPWAITASPSIRNDVALMRLAASTMANGRPSHGRRA